MPPTSTWAAITWFIVVRLGATDVLLVEYENAITKILRLFHFVGFNIFSEKLNYITLQIKFIRRERIFLQAFCCRFSEMETSCIKGMLFIEYVAGAC